MNGNFFQSSGGSSALADRNGSERSFFHLAIIVGCLVLIFSSYFDYLFFHVLVEMFTVVVAFGVFVVAWSSRRYMDNNFLLILGVGYFFIGGFDLIHALSYKGMGVFPESTANVPTQLWIISRYAEAITFLVAFLFLKKETGYDARIAMKKSNWIFAACAAVFTLALLSVFYWKIFPAAYIEGTGLTPFKKASEYVISIIFLGSIALLFRRGNLLDREMVNLLSLSLIVKIASEFSFTGYAGVYDFSNMLGHIFKFISFMLIYKAVLKIGLMKPYSFFFRNLKESEERLKRAQEIAHLGSWELDLSNNKLTWSDETYRIFGLKPREFGATYEAFLQAVHPDDRQAVDAAYSDSIRQGKDVYEIDHRVVRSGTGEIRFVHERCEHFRDKKGKIIRSVGMVHDITERKRAESALIETQIQLRERIEEQLVDSYRHMGTINRKISLLLEIEKHSHQRKNRDEILEHMVDLAKSASHAKTVLLYRHDGGSKFTLISGKDPDEEKIKSLQNVSYEQAAFLKELAREKRRINAGCKSQDIGCFNRRSDINYFVALPLVHGKFFIGFLFLGFEGRISLETEELEFLDVFSIHAASALSRLEVVKSPA